MPHCGNCYIIPAQGETMRILFSFIIAFLFMFLAADISSAQMIEHSCHEEQMSGTMDMEKCRCLHTNRLWSTGAGSDQLEEQACCQPETCKGSLIPKDVALSSTVTSELYFGMVQNPFLSQSTSPIRRGLHHSGLSPPHFFSPPVYIRHCSLLI